MQLRTNKKDSIVVLISLQAQVHRTDFCGYQECLGQVIMKITEIYYTPVWTAVLMILFFANLHTVNVLASEQKVFFIINDSNILLTAKIKKTMIEHSNWHFLLLVFYLRLLMYIQFSVLAKWQHESKAKSAYWN